MNLTRLVRRKVDARYLNLAVDVRYGEDDMPSDAPLRDGDMWCAVIDLDERRVLDWPEGRRLTIDMMKVCDQGSYVLMDANWNVLARLDQAYVPNALLPGKYGDYLCLSIDAEGKITNWLADANLSDFEGVEG